MPRHLMRFCRDESGAITPLMLVLFIGTLMMTGVAMDLLRHEAERADLQAALDRGVLAAAPLAQGTDSQRIVADHVSKGLAPGQAASVSVQQTGDSGSRQVVATASHGMDTAFLNMVGMDRLDVAAAAAVSQARNKVEISLVLDISRSMREQSADGDRRRLEHLQVAAADFIDAVTGRGGNALATVNLVRFAGQVNPGPAMFDLLGGVRSHDGSSCFELDAVDFAHTGLPGGEAMRAQVPHFQHWEMDDASMNWGWCPSDDEAIVYASSDAALLKAEIDAIRLHDGTATYDGMKWGLALLDPASRPFVGALAQAGEVDILHADRPLGWDDPETEKVLVLMTAGRITEQYRPDDPQDPRLASEPTSGGIPHSQTLGRGEGVDRFNRLCDEARALGVTVFTIAYEVAPENRHEMEGCATSPSHFWFAEGRDIGDAFLGIASTVEKLKLVN